VAADVDGAKHGDEHWHERSVTGRRPVKRSVDQSISGLGRWESRDFLNGVKNVERGKCVATRYVSVEVVSLAGGYWVSAGRD
jgi:hypothetical protein